MAGKTASLKAETASEASDLEDLIGYNLKRAYVIVRAHFSDSLGANGLSTRVFAALSLIVQSPSITQSALARRMGIERSGLVAIIDQLEARSYVCRAAVPGDRRVQALVPTEQGRLAYADAVRAVRAHEDALFSGMTAEERLTLLALLKKIRRIEPE